MDAAQLTAIANELDVDAPEDANGLLIVAADALRPDLVQALIDGGADVNFQREQYPTALHSALIRSGNLYTRSQTVRRLLDGGADVNRKVYGDMTPLHAMLTHDPALEIVQMLVERGADINAAGLHGESAVAQTVDHDGAKLRFLLACGPDPNRTDESGRSPLCKAVVYQRQMAATLLLGAGANPNAKDGEGRTPLCCAQGDRDMEALLRLYGAEDEVKDA